MDAIPPPPSPLTSTHALKRVFVDHSMVEAFADNGRAAITRRTYPTSPDAVQVFLFAGPAQDCVFESIEGWQLDSI